MSNKNQSTNIKNKKTNNKKKVTTASKTNSSKKVPNSKKKSSNKKKTIVSNTIDLNSITKSNLKMMFLVILSFGTLFIVSSYAWFSTNLNVKVNMFQMAVKKNMGLSISLDGINFDTNVDISKEILIDELKNRYPNNTSQWPGAGLTPVSSNGIADSNQDKFDIFASSGVRYKNMDMSKGYFRILKAKEIERSSISNYIAFDLFFKNDSGSPMSDNLYLEKSTVIKLSEETNEEMEGLFNSIRLGFVRIGDVPLNTEPNIIQNISCNNSCTSKIYEPNHTVHNSLSIERALKNSVTLVDGEEFPTYGCIKAGGPIWVADAVSGSPNLDYNYFKLQETFKYEDLSNPLFELPYGITKVRVYLWIEGQDIDSLETDSQGAKLDVSIDFIKDTAGYDEY